MHLGNVIVNSRKNRITTQKINKTPTFQMSSKMFVCVFIVGWTVHLYSMARRPFAVVRAKDIREMLKIDLWCLNGSRSLVFTLRRVRTSILFDHNIVPN